jgi:hypothetical protein
MGTVIRSPLALGAEKRVAAGLLSDEQVEAISDKHGGTVAHRIDPLGRWEIVIRQPTRAEFKLYKSDVSNEFTKLDADEALLRKILVYPEAKDAQDALFNQYIGLAEGTGEELAHITGMATKPWGK